MMVLENIIPIVFLFYSITTLPTQKDYYYEDDEQPNNESGQAVSSMNPENIDGSHISGRNRRAADLDEGKRWPNATIPYRIHGFSDAKHDLILKAMRTLEFWTCIKFTPLNETDPPKDFIQIVNLRGSGCKSYRGRTGGMQWVFLEQPACVRSIGIPIHELLHAIGLIDQQNRPDRDNYIEINEHNIRPDKMRSFWKKEEYPVGNFGIPYDYNSIMHYNEHGYSKNEYNVILPKVAKLPGLRIGQRDGMSVRDAMLVMKMYNCSYKDFNVSTTDPFSNILPNVGYKKEDSTAFSKEKLYKIYFMNISSAE